MCSKTVSLLMNRLYHAASRLLFWKSIPEMDNSDTENDEQFESVPLISLNDNSHRSVHYTDDDIEQIALIWLDTSAQNYSSDSLHTKTLIREISKDNCFFFERSEIFLSKIEQIKRENKHILVIMSGSYANTILSSTQDIKEKIIIFCRNYERYANLKKTYSNIVDICTEHEILKDCIYRVFPALKFHLFINQTLQTVRPVSVSQDINDNNTFFPYMIFIEALKNMQQTAESKEIMLNKCIDYYGEDQHIKDFRENYKSEEAIDWYVKSSFVFRSVNRAFRTTDVTLWYLFRYYIIDLCKQLEKEHRKQNKRTSFTVYRGQPKMAINELQMLESHVGCRFSNNGFLSTSKNIEIAQLFIADAKSTEVFKVILYEIIVDALHLKNVVFVDIEQYTKKPREGEILFNIGTVFIIESVSYDHMEDRYRIRMKATDKTDDMKECLDAAKQKILKGNMNLLFGWLLVEMNEYIKALSYFQMLLQVLPTSHKDVTCVYDHIGDLYMRITDYNSALENFNLAYKIKQKNLRSNHQEIGITLNHIGNYYKTIGDKVHALKYYNKALQCKLSPYNKAITQLNISFICMINREYHKALSLCFQACDTLQQIHPYPYTEIIYFYRLIGDIYLAQEEYRIAEGYYLKAFNMSEPKGNYCQTKCVNALIDLYNKQGNNELAINFCSNYLSECQNQPSSNNMTIVSLSMKLSELFEDNDDRKKVLLERALNILENNAYHEYATIANCLAMIAQYYQKQNSKENALKYYNRALKIRKKIYPHNHSIIIETQNILDTLNPKT